MDDEIRRVAEEEHLRETLKWFIALGDQAIVGELIEGILEELFDEAGIEANVLICSDMTEPMTEPAPQAPPRPHLRLVKKPEAP